MSDIEGDTLFVALTRPQMFAGVTYSFFTANAVIAAELFLIFSDALGARGRGGYPPGRCGAVRA